MEASDPAWLQRHGAALAAPAGVAERGVAGAFTTPDLYGARIRAGAAGAVEVVVPHPCGREGWYVLPWPAALDAFRPSLADRALARRLQGEAVSPVRLRQAARAVAAEGLGGRALRRAAAATPEGWAEGGAVALAGRLCRVRALAEALRDWSSGREAAGERERAESLAARALALLPSAASLACAEPPGPERADWLLDGWDMLAALWGVSGPEHRAAALRRMAALVPEPPAEMLRWPGCAALARLPPVPRAVQGRPIPAARCEAALARWMAP